MKEETLPICLTLVILAVTACTGYYHISDRKLMAQNIDSAISKGIDPMSVRCSYASERDIVCVALAASQSHPVGVAAVKK
jgi:hypothetical protein